MRREGSRPTSLNTKYSYADHLVGCEFANPADAEGTAILVRWHLLILSPHFGMA
jgi:hypothetical protein